MKDISKAKGGYALANKMTPEEKKEKAEKMLEARRKRKTLPIASYRGEIKIGDIEIPCAVLENGQRLISEMGILKNLGSTGGKSLKIRKALEESRNGPTPIFLASKALEPFIIAVFDGVDLSPIEYLENDKINRGYPADILPKVCEVWLQARESGTLQESQIPKAKKAEILMRGLARVGIVALIDEATGYEKEREKNSLAKILEAFVAKELQPWLKTFPDEYYSNLFRLWSIPYPPKNNAHYKPSFFGHITNNIVYARLAPELLPELKKSAKTLEKKTKLHQWLTGNVGHPKLREHLSSITTLLKISSSKEEFLELVDKVHPKFTEQYELDFNSK